MLIGQHSASGTSPVRRAIIARSRVLDRDGLLAVGIAGIGGQLERDVVADLGLEALQIVVVHEYILSRAVCADEAIGLAQSDDLARVPLA